MVVADRRCSNHKIREDSKIPRRTAKKKESQKKISRKSTHERLVEIVVGDHSVSDDELERLVVDVEKLGIIDAPDDSGRALLHHAVMKENRRAVELLLRHGADPNVVVVRTFYTDASENDVGRVPLHFATTALTAELLLEEHPRGRRYRDGDDARDHHRVRPGDEDRRVGEPLEDRRRRVVSPRGRFQISSAARDRERREISFFLS